MKKVIAVILSMILTFGIMCIPASAVQQESAEIGTTGQFSAITYNVAGLPIPSTFSENEKDPYDNTILISKMLNLRGYDIIGTQEDFNYDTYLRAGLTNYNNMTVHSGGVPLGDGLNVFTKSADMTLSDTTRHPWNVTYGVIPEGDELTYKGFMVTSIKLTDGVYLDYYVLHADAFDGDNSQAAREDEFRQLAEYIKVHSANRPIIITGDFNTTLFLNDKTDIMGTLIEPLGLNDAWAVMHASEYATSCHIGEMHCGNDVDVTVSAEAPVVFAQYHNYIDEMKTKSHNGYWGVYDSVERFLYRDGGGVRLSCDKFGYESFFDAEGENLSDHSAAIATFTYEVVADPYNKPEITDDEEIEQFSFLFKFLNYLASLFRSIGKLLENYFQWLK